MFKIIPKEILTWANFFQCSDVRCLVEALYSQHVPPIILIGHRY